MAWAPSRGDVIRIGLSPHAGHEQAGRRPALVISPVEYNRRVGLALLCPITRQAKGYPFEIWIPEGHPVKGVVLADQLKSLDWQARQAELFCHVGESTALEVAEKVTLLLTP